MCVCVCCFLCFCFVDYASMTVSFSFSLKIRILPKTPQHLFSQDPVAFSYYYDQVYNCYRFHCINFVFRYCIHILKMIVLLLIMILL